jgi:uncharacterized protein YktA (UPF0223 family)
MCILIIYIKKFIHQNMIISISNKSQSETKNVIYILRVIKNNHQRKISNLVLLSLYQIFMMLNNSPGKKTFKRIVNDFVITE